MATAFSLSSMSTPRTTPSLKSSMGFLKPRNAVSYIPFRSLITLKDAKVCRNKSTTTATSVASGAGWNGNVECSGLKFNIAVPRELGGSGRAANPEQLFAMGYSGMRTTHFGIHYLHCLTYFISHWSPSLPPRVDPGCCTEPRQGRNGQQGRCPY